MPFDSNRNIRLLFEPLRGKINFAFAEFRELR
jgi:hypothetical protein